MLYWVRVVSDIRTVVVTLDQVVVLAGREN
jgi:hypothetical protein